MLNNVCVDVQAEPRLLHVTKEQLRPHSANTSDEARPDIEAKVFWRKGETEFFDIRVTHVNSKSSQNLYKRDLSQARASEETGILRKNVF